MQKNEIVIFDNQQVKLEVKVQDETVWLSQVQMAELFGRERSVITKHVKAVFDEDELDQKRNVQKMHIPFSDKLVAFYSLDVIISVGYRVKSPQGTQFRVWANKVLKQYLLQGYAINQRRLEALEKTIKLLDVARRDDEVFGDQAQAVLQVISDYYQALDLLVSYDKQEFKPIDGTNSDKMIDYQQCLEVINGLKYKTSDELFGQERDQGLQAILGNIYQSFAGKDVYESVEEKAANLLYLVVKNHPFVDGNKRIAAALLIYFLDFYGLLVRDGVRMIDNIALTSLTLLIAQSQPREKQLMVELTVSLLGLR